MNTIASKWDLFVATVLPVAASDIQRQEMRRAFYAGAEGVLDTLWTLGDDTVPEATGVAALETMGRELVQFAADVVGGRA